MRQIAVQNRCPMLFTRLMKGWEGPQIRSLAKYALVVALIFSIGFLSGTFAHWPRQPHWAINIKLPEARRFYQINSKLCRSAQPTAEAFKSYEKFGIQTVINLSHEKSDQDLIRGTSLVLLEEPVREENCREENVITVLRAIKNSPGPVLVHCQRGADRTGLIIAMYRIVFENWYKEAAIEEMINGGYYFNKRKVKIPDFIRQADIPKIRAALDL